MTDQPHGGAPNMNAFTQMWSDFATQMMKSGMAFSPDRSPPEMAQEMRSAMFKAWTEYCDQFMRSADFLNMMKQSMNTSLEARKQLNDFLGRTQHELQQVSRQDVDQLMASLQRMERRMVDGMDEMASQLKHLEQRLDDLEQNHVNGGGSASSPRKKTTRKKSG